IGHLGKRALQDADPHLIVYTRIAIQIDFDAGMLLLIGPCTLEEKVEPLTTLEYRHFDTDRLLGMRVGAAYNEQDQTSKEETTVAYHKYVI
ncbi:MAG TPA: hypothetical protein DIT99_23065, partial [Candidatus Latescibacteria bacterium]|nr:hypothetical protein [Candidatus Latescibacterota bacterium]